MADIENAGEAPLGEPTRTTVRSFGWRNVTVNVQDRRSKTKKPILSCASGEVGAGEILALMGPSYVKQE